MSKEDEIKYLVKKLNEACRAYYSESKEIMSNYEYDALFDELMDLERTTGIVLPDSPTQKAGYEAVSKLKKVTHEFSALSLDKTKDRDKLASWLNGEKGCLSWKLDGLTIIATYSNGKLVMAETHGNGLVGENCTHNAKFFRGLPKEIPYKGKLIVRGEAVMTYKEFERINNMLPSVQAKYKNPRNLASSTVRLLDAKESAQREIWFVAFKIVYTDSPIPDEPYKPSYSNSFYKSLDYLETLGFKVVEHQLVDKDNLSEAISSWEERIKDNIFPTDGLVFMYDDIAYGKSLGSTGRFENCGKAFKWKDATENTVIREIEWSASRTGLLNPVAIFDPVELEGTTVSRASVHNVSIMKSMHISVGSGAEVFKANMIIPQIARVTEPIEKVVIPDKCPVCHGNTRVEINDGVETLYCDNPDCAAKQIGRFSHFVSREGMNIVGLSEATLEKFLSKGFLANLSDIYHLSSHKDEIVTMEGFGLKSYENLIESIENSKKVKFANFLYALGIPNVGKDTAKLITKSLGKYPLDAFVEKLRMGESFDNIEGIGPIINEGIYRWKEVRKNGEEFADLVDILEIMEEEIPKESSSGIFGKTFVITGAVNHFKNRDEIKEYIEKNGGKVSGSVSSKTSFLINNDINSNSGKNKKAKELGVRIITEEELLKL